MASARIEFLVLNSGIGETKFFANTIRNVYAVADITVTSTVTTAGLRPTAPAAFGSYTTGHVRITAIGGALIAVVGADPTASPTALGIRIGDGQTEVLPIKAGEKVSFISVA